jgi:HSP20 family protein
MSNLTRWEPASEFMTLRDAMDRLFDDAVTRPFSLGRNGGSTWSSLPIDMYQTNDDVVVKAVVPGIRPDQVQINVTGDVLTIRGEVSQEEERTSSAQRKDRAWHIREHRLGSFERAVALPVNVVSDKATAEFENGILTITLPKAEEVKPKTISIKARK